MVNKIGFSNFRRFAEFPEIDFGDVTVLVGGNNSGKSTIVKALLLCVDNLRLMRINDKRRGDGKFILPSLSNQKPIFRFDGNEFHDVKIKEFSRAIHNGFVDGVLPTEMTLKFALDHFHFTIVVSGNRDENSTIGDVERITIEDTKADVSYTVDYKNDIIKYETASDLFKDVRSSLLKTYESFCNLKKDFEERKNESSLEHITNMTASIDKIRALLTSAICKLKDGDYDEDKAFTDDELSEAIKEISSVKEYSQGRASYDDIPYFMYVSDVAEPVVLNVISNFIMMASLELDAPEEKEGQDPAIYKKEMEEHKKISRASLAIEQDLSVIKESYDDLSFLLNNLNINYISAHAANQNSLYNTADKNDYIAQTVHEFWREKIERGHREYDFIKKWMKVFEIGVDFEIKPLVPGEAYVVTVEEESGAKVLLADKGMGSIQIMILLLRIATILAKFNPNGIYSQVNKVLHPIIIIEEPEQNLHPKMQSKLADLFYSLAKDWGCKFLIETHSEYLVRKSQVIVAEENFANEEDLKENNHFKVYYLPSDGLVPYEMKYRIDGKFSNEFGPGFFDTASDLAFELF